MSYMDLDEERKQYIRKSKQLPSDQLYMTYDENSKSNLSGTFNIYNESHTTANLLRYGLKENHNISFVGHCEPHPLENKLCIDVSIYSKSKSNIKEIMKQTIHDRIQHIQDIRQTLRHN